MQRVTADQADGIGHAARMVDGARGTGAGSSGSSRMRRMMWSRALPVSAILLAAFTIPELSVGAGDFAGGQRPDGPAALSLSAVPEPLRPMLAATPAATPAAIKAPLSGVRDTPAFSLSAPRLRAEPLAQSPLPLLPAVAQDNVIAPVSAPAGVVPAAAPATARLTLPVRAPADLSGLNTGSLLAASLPIEPVALAKVALPIDPGAEAVRSPPAPLLPAPPLPAAPAAIRPVADVPRVRPMFGGTSGSFSALVPPEELAAKQVPAARVLPVAPANPALVAVDARPASAGVLGIPRAAAPAPAMVSAPAMAPAPTTAFARTIAPATTTASTPTIAAAPVSRQQPQPSQQLALPPVRAAVSAAAAVVPPAVAVPPATPPVARRAPAPARAAPVAAPAQAPVAKLVPLPPAKPPLAIPGLGANGTFPIDGQTQLVTRVDGKAAGKLDFQQAATGLLVRVGSIVELLGDRFEPAQLAWIKASAASDAYLPLAALQAQGIPISYDPVYDEFNVGLTDTRPKAARKAHMDQISAPERGLGSTAIEQVRR